MNRALIGFLVFLLVAGACARLWEPPAPVPVFAKPLSPNGVIACLKTLQRAGIECQLDPQGTGLLVEPARLEEARVTLATPNLQTFQNDDFSRVEIPGGVRETLLHLPGVTAASIRVVGEEALVMLDLQNRPSRDFLATVTKCVVTAYPKIQPHNVKIVDAQCRDWTVSVPSSAEPLVAGRKKLAQDLRRQTQRQLDEEFGWGKSQLELDVSYDDSLRYYPHPKYETRPNLALYLTLRLAPMTPEQRGKAAARVKKLKSEWRLKESRGDIFSLKVEPWTASQRPLSRGELEQLKAGLVSAAPPPTATADRWGLGLLILSLVLWGIATSRLLDRHHVASSRERLTN
jgi:hypothetical protein